jgi:hypothetical protein
MQTGVATAQVECLLGELCVKLGFSEPARRLPQVMAAVPSGPDAFVDLVLSVEGLDPSLNNPLRRQARELVARHFGSWSASRAA